MLNTAQKLYDSFGVKEMGKVKKDTSTIFHIDSIKVLNMTPEFHEIGYDNIKQNLVKTTKRVEPAAEVREDKVAIVGYGPSLKETWKMVANYDVIITMSGAHDFLIQRGIMPTYHIDCDPRPHKAEFTKNAKKEVKYLMASSCHPDAIDQLMDYDLTLWNLETTKECPLPEGERFFPGMGCIGLQSLLIARHVLGYRNMVLFGMDCSFKDNKTHASYHPRSQEQGDRIRIGIGEYAKEKTAKDYKIFSTSVMLVVYAKEMYLWMSTVLNDCQFEVVGDGLLPAYLMYEVEKANKLWQQTESQEKAATMSNEKV